MFGIVDRAVTLNSPDATISDRLRTLVPLLGNSEAFIAALHRYQLGKLRLNEREVEEARIQGLVVLIDVTVEAGLFLSLFGRGLLWGTGIVRSALLTCYTGRVLRVASLGEFDLIEPLSRRLLTSSPSARAFMDSVFEFTRRGLVSTIH
ncbi:MAG: hypothetical protein KDD70_06880 [Bdellovibrionales bacterium]|nr:hypothetical protein [Bdellovibrionales bacterium]